MKFFRSWLVIGLAAIAGCSEKIPSAAVPASPQIAPTQTATTNELPGSQAITAEVAAGGIPTSYIAYFEQNQPTRIDETRRSNRGSGSYEFYGARLLKYSGTALDSNAQVLLEFGMSGTVDKARSGSGPATDTQIESIRNRGQLLRSHALAQRSTRAHTSR